MELVLRQRCFIWKTKQNIFEKPCFCDLWAWPKCFCHIT